MLIRFVILCAAMLSYATSAFATVRIVPVQHLTIQGAIDASLTGDTVLVLEGTYYGHFRVENRDVTLASQYILDGDTSHVSSTILDGDPVHTPVISDSGSVVRFINAAGSLLGLAIRRGTGTVGKGGGIYVDNQSEFGKTVEIRQCRFAENTATQGSGCYFHYSSSRIDTSVFANQQVWRFGGWSTEINHSTITGGLIVTGSANAAIRNCSIDDISTLYFDQPSISCYDSYISGSVHCGYRFDLRRSTVEGVAAYWDFGFSAEDCILGSVLAEASGEGLVQRSVVGGVGFNGNFPLFACHDCLILDSISAGGGDWLTLKRSILVCGTDTAVSYGADSFIDLDTVLLYTPGSPVIHAVGTPSSFDTNLIVWQNPQLCWTGLGATVAPTSPALPANNPWAVHFGNAVGDPVCDPCCAFVTGNVDYDPGDVCDGSDLQALVDYIFFGMVEAIKCSDEADLSGDDLVDPSDLQTMIDFVFFNTDLRRSCRLFRDL